MSDLALGEMLKVLIERVDTLDRKLEIVRATLTESVPSRAPGSELRPAKQVLSYANAAHALDISVSTLKRMLAKGQIINCDVGDGKGIPQSEILRIAAGRKPGSKAAHRPERARPPRGSAEREKIREALRAAKKQ